MSGDPGWSREKPGCPKIVLWDVLLELDLVLLDKRCCWIAEMPLSLILKSRQSRQVPAGAMSPLVTPSPFLLIVE